MFTFIVKLIQEIRINKVLKYTLFSKYLLIFINKPDI